jgi:hypothetical protein
MRLVHDDYTKGQRALCAFTGQPSVPGFKGGPLIEHLDKPREISYLNLARFTYAQTTLLNGLAELCTLKKTTEGWRIAKMLPIDQKTLATLFPNQPERIERINEQYARVLERFVARLPETIYRVSSNANADLFIESIRTESRVVILFAMLDQQLDALIHEGNHLLLVKPIEFTPAGKKKTEDRVSPEFLGLIDLKQVFTVMIARLAEARDKNRAKGEANGLGRRLFTAKEEERLRAARSQLATLDEEAVLRILGTEKSSPLAEIIRRTLPDHWRYGMSACFELAGQNYQLEASPFTQKAIGTPRAKFTLTVYPKDERVTSQLQAIGYPAFEHSPGAIGSARFTFPNQNMLLVEELQTDVESLLRIHNAAAAEELAAVLKQWREITFQAVHLFAAANGFNEFFAATPLRLLSHYGGPMHPVKSFTYFDFWEKRGGKLVLDEDYEVGERLEHFYRFETEAVAAENVVHFEPPVKKGIVKSINIKQCPSAMG